MKTMRIIIFKAIGILMLIIVCACNTNDKLEEMHIANKVDTVNIDNMQFEPRVLKVNYGDTILWINKGIVAHNISNSADSVRLSGDFAPGESYATVLRKDLHYYCSIHPTMSGEIIVKETK